MRFGVGAFVAVLVLGAIGTGVVLADFDEFADDQLRQGGLPVTAAAEQALFVSMIGIAVLFVALTVVALVFAWRGYGWGRVLLFVLGGLTVLGGLSALGQPATDFAGALSVCQMLLAIAGLVLLIRPGSAEWYRAMGRWRAARPFR